MLRKILTAAVAVSALGLTAPVASAHDPIARCGFDSIQQDDLTGQSYEGVAYGVIVDWDATAVSIRCYITVNGAEVSSTPPRTGTKVAVTHDVIKFQALNTDVVEICTQYTATSPAGDRSGTSCVGSDHFQIPPQEIIDLLIQIFDTIDNFLEPVWTALENVEITYVDPLVCPILAGLPSVPGVVDIVPGEGDTTILGTPFWDCPPYGNLFA